MFDIGWSEIMVIAVVALIAIGPKELPRVLFEAGKWVRRLRLMAAEFQRHFGDIMHEAELDELRRQARAAQDMMQPRSLAELVDPGGTIRDSLDPTHAGGAGYPGSPVEPPAPPAPPTPPPVALAGPVSSTPPVESAVEAVAVEATHVRQG